MHGNATNLMCKRDIYGQCLLQLNVRVNLSHIHTLFVISPCSLRDGEKEKKRKREKEIEREREKRVRCVAKKSDILLERRGPMTECALLNDHYR